MLCFVYTNFSDIGKLTNSVCSVYETAVSNCEFSECFLLTICCCSHHMLSTSFCLELR